MEGTNMFWKKLAILAGLAGVVGCHGAGDRGATYDASYGLPPDVQAGVVPTQEKTFVDRHPALAAPRNYYRDSSDYFVVKVLAGTFVGIPVGVVRESWQIVYGQ